MHHYHHFSILSRLSLARYNYCLNDDQLIASAVHYAGEALHACEVDKITYPTVLIVAGGAVNAKASQNSKSDYWIATKRAYMAALVLCGTGHPLRTSALSRLSQFYVRYFQSTGISSTLNMALGLQHMAVTNVALLESEMRPRHLAHICCYGQDLALLGSLLLARHFFFGDPDGFQEGVRLCQKGLSLCPPLHLECPSVMYFVAQGLRNCFEIAGARQDLDDAITMGEQAITATPPRTTINSRWLAIVSTMLKHRFEVVTASDQDLDRVVQLKQEALSCYPPGHVDHMGFVISIANTLQTRFLWNGDIDDINQAVQLHRKVVENTKKLSQNRVAATGNLIQQLILRYEALGHVEDLKEALHMAQTEIKKLSPTGYEYGSYALSLVSALNHRYEVFHNIQDLEEAIAIAEENMHSLAPNSRYHIECIRGLSRALSLRGIHKQDKDDLEKAMRIFQIGS
jgi:tetratricopeptide (TPR) repeat protein